MLTAELNMIEEGTRGRQGINLNDRIGNDNGRLVVSCSPYGGLREVETNNFAVHKSGRLVNRNR